MIDAVTRPAGDILSRAVRITLGGQAYVLPVRSIRANREWKAQLDLLTAAKVDAITSIGGTGLDRLEQILTVLDHEDMGSMIDLLLSYDTSGVLPTREAIEEIEPDASLDIIAACQEVWRAASPLVDTTLGMLEATIAPLTSDGLPPTSSPRRSTAGRRKRSRSN